MGRLTIRKKAYLLFSLLKFLLKEGKVSQKQVAWLTAIILGKLKVERDDLSYFKFFKFWQKLGVTIVPNTFYQPIPDLTTLPGKILDKHSPGYGINFNETSQLGFLKKFFPRYKKAYSSFPKVFIKGVTKPHEFHFNNGSFDFNDAKVYYSMIRHFKPKIIIEVGSGWSTKLAAQACLKNGNTELVSIEPYPQEFLTKKFPGFTRLIRQKIENVKTDYFQRLNKNDILFIDSTHTVKVGSDVNYLFFEILPKLKKGVIIHVHDFFLPEDYPKRWVLNDFKFWNEQYLVQAFLMYNQVFKVIYANTYMSVKYPKLVLKNFGGPLGGGSLWLQKN